MKSTKVNNAPGATSIKTCFIKRLPSELMVAAADKAVEINPMNAPAIQQFKHYLPEITLTREYIAALTTKYWQSGRVNLSVGFLDITDVQLRNRILSHMNAWSLYGNITFSYTDTDPQVRISTTPGSGYWSYLGTDILSTQIKNNEPTMNLDSFTMNTEDSEFHRVIRHETGHTLGFPHEHMRLEIVDRIDRDKAIAFFKLKYNWEPPEVISQVLTPLDNSALIKTNEPDVNSIMCYWLPGEIMKDGKDVPGGMDIDLLDGQFAAMLYKK
jgi:hypothetical protein